MDGSKQKSKIPISQQLIQQKNSKTVENKNVTASTSASSINSTNTLRINRGSKPFLGKKFYLDIKNHTLSSKLETKITNYGGTIELFLVKTVNLVITDRSDKSTKSQVDSTSAGASTATAFGAARLKWVDTSGGSGGPPSLMSLEAPTPTPTPPTPYRSVEGPLSNSTNQRGSANQRTKSRADAMLERALTQPQQCSVDPLNNAQKWGISIWTINDFYVWFGKIEKSIKEQQDSKQHSEVSKQIKIKHLKNPFIKFESYRRESRPIFLELKSWPTLNFNGSPGTCPFDVNRKENKETDCIVHREIKENREKCFNPDTSKVKDMTRRPRAVAPRVRKTDNTGYCEICRIEYKNLSKHLQTDQHLNFVRDDKNFLSLDNLISTGASVEAFLKKNRSKDDSKDCSIYSDRDETGENVLLSSDEKSEKKEDESNLSAYSVENMKMQCNGARKNLNSELDAQHNLRTRIKHESGHLLRSKGKPFEDNIKSEKPSEKFVITKRAKGTIWIEEDDSDNEKDENELVNYDGKPFFNKSCDENSETKKTNGENFDNNVLLNGDVGYDASEYKFTSGSPNKINNKNCAFNKDTFSNISAKKFNGRDKEVNDGAHIVEENLELVSNKVNNVHFDQKFTTIDNEDTNSVKSLNKEDRGKCRLARRGGRTYRGRQRLSVEERLIEDNRDYYKVEVLGNKLRSSAIPCNNPVLLSPTKDHIEKIKSEDDKPSSEKPVVVRFKRVRKSELSLLSDEAESFMFGDPKREDDSSDDSDVSVLPNDTESDKDGNGNSMEISSSSSPNNVTLKQEISEDDSQDSNSAKAKKKRRTQTEALLKDNTDYYKFEIPGSRLRYQAPLTGVCDVETNGCNEPSTNITSIVSPKEKLYPSMPSAEVEKMHYSFEAVPRSEPWYLTYERQDKGDEFYYSESDSQKPFLLPYEIENFHEILQKSLAQSKAQRKRGRGRGTGHLNMGSRLPRKSPRCHASTLAIMSTIIRRREQQTATNKTEDGKKSNNETTIKPDKKTSEKSTDVDEELKILAKNVDEMLSDEVDPLEDFSVNMPKNLEESTLPETRQIGAPTNLLELLEHVGSPTNGFDNSSCASSDCGELLSSDFPQRRRKKKRKNKTGWPGNKMRRKLHIKNLNEELQKELQKEMQLQELNSERNLNTAADTESLIICETKSTVNDNEFNSLQDARNIENEHETEKENEQQVLNLPDSKDSKYRKNKKDNVQDVSETEELDDKTVLKRILSEEGSPRKKRNANPESKFKIEEDEIESQTIVNKGLLMSSEDSEASMSNNKNLYSKDTNALIPYENRSPVKFKRKRQRKNTTSSETSNNVELENQRQSSVVGPILKKQKYDEDSEIQEIVTNNDKKNKTKQLKCKKRNNDKMMNKEIFDDENCTKESFLSLKNRRKLKRPRRRNHSLSSELPNGELDPSDRLSPTSDVGQRRSSIDFQPVVRVMKIDHSVEVDNNVLSVAVASNRRLRSSTSSPKSKKKSPKKRFRNNGSNRRHISGLGMKNS